MRTAVTSVLMGLLALTACTSTEPGSDALDGGAQASQAQTVQDLLGHTFEVQSYAGAGKDVTLVRPVTIYFEEDAWSVSTPCNSHGGSGVTYTNTNIDVTENWLTAVGCPEDLVRQSNFITDLFAGDPEWEVSGDELTLRSGDMTIVAVRVPSLSADSASTGTLEGRVLMSGGPLNPDTGKQAISGSPAASHSITVVNTQTGAEYMATSDTAGRFSVDLPAGSYLLKCEDSRQVRVRAGGVAHSDCLLPVP